MKERPPSMDCDAFEKISHHLYRPDVAEAALCEAALSHAESCSRCAALLSEIEWLEFSMLDLARQNANRQASPRVESALVQEFQRQKAEAARRQIHNRLAVLAIAAVLLLVLGLTLPHRVGLWLSSSSTPDVAASHPQPAVAPAPSQAAVRSPAQAPMQTTAATTPEAPRPQQHPASKQSSTSGPSDSEYATDFVPLPYTDDSAAQDGGAVVRVVLSRSALASFGLPVADFASSDQIQADLIVGADGMPQAIRLVSQLNSSEEF